MRRLYFGLITFFISLLSLNSLHAAIIINEIMPCNISTKINEYQNYTGWVEIYNNGSSNVNLRNHTFVNVYLEEGVEVSKSWKVTQDLNVSANNFRLIYFDEEAGANHADYKLETEGGRLILLDPNGTEVNRLSYQKMLAHVSWGRANANDPGGYMAYPTPEAANAPSLGSTLRRVQKPTFGTTQPGIQTATSVTVTLQSESGASIYYTLNGSEPTKSSTLYTGAITVSQTTVIRARAYRDNVILSDIAAGTYVFFKKDAKGKDYHSPCSNGFTVPIVSISTDSDNFFGNQMGIYVKGTNGISSGKSCDPGPANYFRDWKRPVHFEYIVNGKQVISQELDAAVMGGCSRGYMQKSLKLTASKKQGNNKIEYDFFPSDPQVKEYKSLQLRNLGNDYNDTRIRDPFMQALVRGRMNIDYQGYQPVAFYINGEYWGHIAMMERANKDYVYSRYGLHDYEVDMLEVTSDGVDSKEGDMNAYNNLINRSKTGQTSSNYYEEMNRLMDIDEYIDYQIIEQYVGNTDWPNNNTRLWRESTTGRFRWILYDTDFGFGLYNAGGPNYTDVNLNMINFALGQGSTNWANKQENMVILFSNLMKNNEFRQRFLNRYILHLGTTFVPKRVTDILESVRAGAKDEICAHWKRFERGWYEGNSLTTFANQRQGIVYNHLRDYFGLGSSVDLKISAIPANIGADFVMNGERLNTSNYDGKYYKDRNLIVEPVAPVGYRFVSWNLSTPPVTKSILNSQTTWKYYNQGNQPSGNWYGTSYSDTGSEWKTGSGTFGYQTNTVRPSGFYTTPLEYGGNENDKWVTAYFRTSFEISNVSAMSDIQVTVLYDDGVVIYLNGNEIKRYNMPSSAISYGTSASSIIGVDEEQTFTIASSLLQTGTNVIAVEVHQIVESTGKVTSSDLTFKLSMTGKEGSGGNGSSSSNQAYSTKVTEGLNLVATFEKVNYVKPKLFINELCASNGKKSNFHDGYGNYGDWIEIYNAGNVAVDLGGMYLQEVTKGITYQFPTYRPFETTVPAGEYKVIFADKQMWQGPLHANFKLTKGAASTLSLYEMEGTTKREIDRVSYPSGVGTRNESYGRETDGDAKWVFFEYCEPQDKYLATPGRRNGSEECGPNSVEDVIFNSSAVVMNLYPNPAKTVLNIAVNTSDAYSLQVYDDKGRLMESMPVVNENVAALNLQGYVSGVYIVKVVTKEAVLQQKFIKY